MNIERISYIVARRAGVRSRSTDNETGISPRRPRHMLAHVSKFFVVGLMR